MFARTTIESRLTPVGVGLAVILAVYLAVRVGVLMPMELWAYDLMLRFSPKVKTHHLPRIAIITLDERDIHTLNQWPLTDDTLARTLNVLQAYQPRAVGLDIFRDVPVPPGTEEFRNTLRRNDSIIVVNKFVDAHDTRVDAPTVLLGSDQIGFNDILVDAGGLVRRGLLFLHDGDQVGYSFSLRLAFRYLRDENIFAQSDGVHPEYLKLGEVTLPPLEANDGGYVAADSRGYQFLLDFRDDWRAFPHFGLPALLDGHVPPETLRDAVVLIGVTAPSVKDDFYIPGDRQIAGVELHALMVSQLLRFALDGEKTLITLDEWQETAWLALWAALGVMLAMRSQRTIQFAAVGVGGLVLLIGTTCIAFCLRLWIPVIAPAGAWLAAFGLMTASLAHQRRIHLAALDRLFASYVSPEIAREIWRLRDAASVSGKPEPQETTATVLFSDICGFTASAEQLEANALMGWLNAYLESMTRVVAAHGGVVIRFVGDAILAGFGVPPSKDAKANVARDALSAVECALAMQDALVPLNATLIERRLPLVRIRIGIQTGPVIAGSLGDLKRLEYNIHGDTVNTASRLETLDKESFKSDPDAPVCRILIGEETRLQLDERFETVEIGDLMLRGRSTKLKVFRVVGRSGGVS